MAVQLDYALRPQDLASLRITDTAGIQVKNWILKANCDIATTDQVREFVAKLQLLRRRLRCGNHYLFPKSRSDSHCDISQLSRHLERALLLSHGLAATKPDSPGIRHFTWTTLRDLGAVRLIRQDATRLLRVADLLNLSSVAQVTKRFGPFLPGGSGGR